jgi:hypothetical protein
VLASVECSYHVYTGTATVLAPPPTGNLVTVLFSPRLPEPDCCRIDLTGDVEGQYYVATLGGDVDFDGEVTAIDTIFVTLRFQESATEENFRRDVDCDGRILTPDVAKVKSRFGNIAPQCP